MLQRRAAVRVDYGVRYTTELQLGPQFSRKLEKAEWQLAKNAAQASEISFTMGPMGDCMLANWFRGLHFSEAGNQTRHLLISYRYGEIDMLHQDACEELETAGEPICGRAWFSKLDAAPKKAVYERFKKIGPTDAITYPVRSPE